MKRERGSQARGRKFKAWRWEMDLARLLGSDLAFRVQASAAKWNGSLAFARSLASCTDLNLLVPPARRSCI
eukprot:825767-Pyramimonas_sp.AAC.1